MSRQRIGKGLDKVIAMIHLQGMYTRDHDGLHVGIDKVFAYFKLFPENIQLPITSDEAYEHNAAIRDYGDGRNLRYWVPVPGA